MEKLLFSIEETAPIIGLSKYTIRAYVQKGLIKPTRIGNRVLIPIAEINRIATEGLHTGSTKN
jgi:excisionase family DNA binding protein